jgi:DNA-binding HxlR family transcriptional regulator
VQDLGPAELVEHDDSWHGDSSVSGADVLTGTTLRSPGVPPGTFGFMQNVDGATSLADCPTRLAVEFISDKWAVLALFALGRQPRRHGELVDLIGGVSRKVLTQTLRRLQQYGLVDREAKAPKHVEYRLTDLGRTLIEPIEVLTTWASEYGGAIVDFQEAAESALPLQAGARRHARHG